MTIQENLSKVLNDVEKYNPKIIAVTKYYDENKMIEAFNCGLRDFGESRVPECIKKIGKIDDTIKSQSIYHFIGHLQTNKVKYTVGFFEYIHSVDSLKLAQAINLEAEKKGIIQKILLQINNANEPQKFGIPKEQIENLIEEVSKLKSVKLEGLMNIAPLTDDTSELKRLFSEMFNIIF